MKHLPAKQNLGHTVQAVEFKDLYRLSSGSPDAIWVNLWDYFENYWYLSHPSKPKDWLPWIKKRAASGEDQVWGGKNMIAIKKSIEKHGMQFPIALLYNRSEDRIEYHDFGWRRIKYAILNEYTSIDAIVKENMQEVIELDAYFGSSARDPYFKDLFDMQDGWAKNRNRGT